MLNWAKQFSIFCLLDNHQYQIEPHTVECMVAVGSKRSIISSETNSLANLQKFIGEKKSWMFGHLNYDLKNEIESLTSSHTDHLGFPELFFFEPEYLVKLGDETIVIKASDPQQVYYDILESKDYWPDSSKSVAEIQSRISKDDYIEIVQKLQQHILRGDCYEINFCQEFFSENARIDPLSIYEKLSVVSPNPFSALYKLNDKYLICASPERFIKKEGMHILSQPIKGTAKRDSDQREADKIYRERLYYNQKDRSENVMVVDLVRNDLAKICKEGSVHVDELYGVYSFPQVYQMISTVSGNLKDDISFTDIIRATFPMGSMTGAPKRSVLKLIENYERSKRGIFSGALGYITPEQDFDFNVVIRSIMYNETNHYLSYQAGSGITFYSKPESEWEECLLKAAAINKVLKND